MAQPHRASVQQAQELAAGRHPLRQNQGILPRLRRTRLSQTMDTLCPRNLVVGSHNLTGGGLWTNFESSTLIPLEGSNASVAQIQGSMDDFFARLNSLGESIMPIGAQEDVENRLQNGYVIKEVTEKVRQDRKSTRLNPDTNAQLDC